MILFRQGVKLNFSTNKGRAQKPLKFIYVMKNKEFNKVKVLL